MGVFLSVICLAGKAQIGEYRNDFSVGVNGGYVLSNVQFVPKVPQGLHGGITGGLSVRYVCEKYFSTICAIYGEVNFAQLGWKENILDVNDAPVINEKSQMPEEYSRTINYLQIPLFAHLSWGRENKGMKFFFNAGPQMGFKLSEATKTNFELPDRNRNDRVNNTVQQDTMAVENSFDYGIAAGLGVEYSHPKVGHLLLEARYYYGLGNIYGDTKRDFFGRSNFGNIIVKMTYLFDITRTRKTKGNNQNK
ncbi:MAG: PorT family protein [Prevotella sp.]|nr:PorT family protein [Prevotella sp.]